MIPSSPCHNCERREIGCHCNCKDYNDYCTEKARINSIINEAKENEAKLFGVKKRVLRSKK
jgi:hypothetical protein